MSPLAYWSYRVIWVRSLQDMLLANVATVFVLGAPWLALRRRLEFGGWLAGGEPGPRGTRR